MITFVMIGSGFRAQSLLNVAKGLSTVRCVGVAVRCRDSSRSRPSRLWTRDGARRTPTWC